MGAVVGLLVVGPLDGGVVGGDDGCTEGCRVVGALDGAVVGGRVVGASVGAW